jgi:glycosyltransferase involved in cell wall biosynthesis
VKIAVLGPAHPLRGGIVYYLALLDRALRAAGHDVTFAGFLRQYPEHVPDLPFVRRLRFPGSDQVDDGAETVPVASTPVFVPWSPRSWWRTARLIAASGARCVVLKWWIPFFGPGYTAVTRLLERRGVRTIAILDNVVPHEGWPMGRMITRLGLGSMHGYIAQSAAVRDDLMALLPATAPDRVRLVHHPTYDFGPGRAGSREAARAALGVRERHLLLFFGFIKPYKGLMVLIEALPLLRERLGDSFRLLVVGDFYEDRAPYDRRIAELGVGDRIELVAGYAPNDAVADYFVASDLVVLPYRSATQSGIVQIAYNYARPVVTTRVGGMPEFVDDGATGYLVPPDDPAALAAAVTRYLEEADRPRFAAAIAEKRRAYSWEALVDAIVDLGAPRDGGR